jgi:hypothetical protein
MVLELLFVVGVGTLTAAVLAAVPAALVGVIRYRRRAAHS